MATGFRKWNEYLSGGLQMEVWKHGFTLITVKFKIRHFITAARKKLILWEIVDSDICSFCNEAIETLPM